MNTTSTHASFTGSIPETYDTYLGPLLFESPSADMAKRVSTALGKPARVLEVACGTGISTRHLAGALAPGSELTATDLNQAMLDHAQRVNGDLTGVSYSQADALDLPFDDASFDAVVCQFGIMFFPDKGERNGGDEPGSEARWRAGHQRLGFPGRQSGRCDIGFGHSELF